MKLLAGHNASVFVKTNFLQVVLIHVVVLGVAPFFFTWKAFAFSFGVALLFAYSMEIFHHMLLTHRSFKCKKWMENTGALFGTLTWRGPFAGPVQYVAMHKIHHAFADTDLDPHTPVKGVFFAFIGWFWNMPKGFASHANYDRYAPEVMRDPWYRFLDRNVHFMQAAWGALCFFVGGMFPILFGGKFDTSSAIRYFVFGVFVKSFLVIYLVNAVDVINHTVGYRGYETKDHSTNSFLMAFIHLGGSVSWHNNHHAHQHYFSVKRRWWEFDVHHMFLNTISRFGWVWDVEILDERKIKPLRVR